MIVILIVRVDLLKMIAPLLLGAYLFIAMKTAYAQSFMKTLVKFGMLGFAYSITLVVALAITVLTTILFV
jgi:hypothetical protein